VLLEFGANPNDADSTSVKRFRGWLRVNFLVRKMWGKLGKPTRNVANLVFKASWKSGNCANLGGVRCFRIFFHVHPYLGKVSNLTNN